MGMQNFMASKLLALTVLILLIATAISIGCALLPFWFRLHFGPEDATYGSEGARSQELQIGIFYIYKPYKHVDDGITNERTQVLMTSLLALDKAANLPVVPPLFKIGQVFYTIGVFGTAVSMGGAFVLACKQYGSLSGNFGLAIFSLFSGIFQVLGIIFAVFTALDSESTWHMMPLDNPFRFVIETHPTMSMDWGFYIAIIGAALAVVGSVLMIIEALKICKTIEEIRSRQRKTKPPEEPYPDIRYTRFSYADVPRPKPDIPTYEIHGHFTPGVVISRGPPQQHFIAQPQPSPQPPRYGDYPPEPPPQPYMEYTAPPPGYVSRQVDL